MCNMSDIPDDLLSNIFSRLPTEVVCGLRCVCKAWRSLINEHGFRKLHAIRSCEQHGHQDDVNLYIMDCGYKKKQQLGNRINSISISHYDNLCKFLVEYLNFKPNIDPILPLPSCDSLILIPGIGFDQRYRHWVLCNPFSGDFHKLPRDPYFSNSYYWYAGFGYDHIHDDYKVAQVYSHPMLAPFLATSIYSLKSNEWHLKKEYYPIPQDNPVRPPDTRMPLMYDHGVFFNGAIHWIANLQGNTILALDLSTENYHLLQTPLQPYGTALYNRSLTVLGGELLFMGSSERLWSVWRMNDYGGNNTWTKFMSFDHLHRVEVPRSVDLGYPKLMAYDKGKQKVLIMYNSYKFQKYKKAFWFDLVKKRMTEVRIKHLPGDVMICNAIPASLTSCCPRAS